MWPRNCSVVIMKLSISFMLLSLLDFPIISIDAASLYNNTNTSIGNSTANNHIGTTHDKLSPKHSHKDPRKYSFLQLFHDPRIVEHLYYSPSAIVNIHSNNNNHEDLPIDYFGVNAAKSNIKVPKCHIILIDNTHKDNITNHDVDHTHHEEHSDWMHILPASTSTKILKDNSTSDHIPSRPTLKSFMSIFHTIMDHARDIHSPIYSLLHGIPSISNSYPSKKQETRSSTTTISSTNRRKESNGSLPEYILFGTVSSANRKLSRDATPPLNVATFIRFLQHLENVASSDFVSSTISSAMSSSSCDIYPFPVSKTDVSFPVTVSQSLKQTLGQYGIKAWTSLLKALAGHLVEENNANMYDNDNKNNNINNSDTNNVDENDFLTVFFNVSSPTSPTSSRQNQVSAASFPVNSSTDSLSSSASSTNFRITSHHILQSLHLPVFAHAHLPSHPFHLAKMKLAAGNTEQTNNNNNIDNDNHQVKSHDINSRHFRYYPNLFPVIDLVPSEPFQLFALKTRQLLPLAQLMILAETVLEQENQWNVKAVFHQNENMKLQIFEKLPAFFLHFSTVQLTNRNEMNIDANDVICKPFHVRPT